LKKKNAKPATKRGKRSQKNWSGNLELGSFSGAGEQARTRCGKHFKKLGRRGKKKNERIQIGSKVKEWSAGGEKERAKVFGTEKDLAICHSCKKKFK